MKLFKYKILSIFIGVLLSFLCCEIILRFFPVTEILNIAQVNEANPYLHFLPNDKTKLSIGKYFQVRTIKKTNSHGYFDDLDFIRKKNEDKISIIGDSYVEAIHVKNKNSIHGQLDSMLNPTYRVNGIGSSGSALSQYVAYAKLARDSINPNLFVFVVVGNDFDESLLRYKNSSGHHYYNDSMKLVRIDTKNNALIMFVKSALRNIYTFRYLMFNLKIQSIFQSAKIKYSDNTFVQIDKERLDWSRKAVDAFLKDILFICGR